VSGLEREQDMINMNASASSQALVTLFCFQGSQWTYSEAEQFMQNIDVMNSNLLKPFECQIEYRLGNQKHHLSQNRLFWR